MAFLIRKRVHSATLIRRKLLRSADAPKGNYSYSTEVLGTIPLAATALPESMRPDDFSPAELASLEVKVFLPARQRAELERQRAIEALTDPLVCLVEAARQLEEGARRSVSRPLHMNQLVGLWAALRAVRVSETVDVLHGVRQAIAQAREAIAAGALPNRPVEMTLKDSPLAAEWQTLRAEYEALRTDLRDLGYVRNAVAKD